MTATTLGQEKVVTNFPRSEQSPDEVDNYGEQYAEQDHGGNRKIKPEIFFLHPDIARKATDPMKFIVKKIDDNAYHDNAGADDYDPFSGICVHISFLIKQQDAFNNFKY